MLATRTTFRVCLLDEAKTSYDVRRIRSPCYCDESSFWVAIGNVATHLHGGMNLVVHPDSTAKRRTATVSENWQGWSIDGTETPIKIILERRTGLSRDFRENRCNSKSCDCICVGKFGGIVEGVSICIRCRGAWKTPLTRVPSSTP